MKPTLLILAAGLGNRYGGLKQLDEVGPNGETIMDYSVYDAKRAGFGKIVFVIRKDFAAEFEKKILSKYINQIDAEYVFQDVNDIPEGCNFDTNRKKPWGTGHAVIVAEKAINTPFAVVNADDFYGYDAFCVTAEYLQNKQHSQKKYSMVGYIINNTLSESGSVSRGVCKVNENNVLTNVIERTKIERTGESITYIDENGNLVKIQDNAIVSMNFWGFTPDYFDYSKQLFIDFLKENRSNNEAEFYIPTVVNNLIGNRQAEVKVLSTNAKWFGITYSQDKIQTKQNINKLIENGEYPQKIFK
ncbi:MAG: nucleotidyltransferase [Prevotellaceae bacterium]|jgi:UTP-glucose-1-phosphate uridylyltransferase|nr:nucleotidyltransferase [Prevotellaceae bacterium]